MSRFFRVELTILNVIRMQVIDTLDQPNGRADEPWPVDGTFNDGSHGFVALANHHTTGEFAPLLDQFIVTAGVEEVDEDAYLAAAPEPEELA